jgi:hypothetical protein
MRNTSKVLLGSALTAVLLFHLPAAAQAPAGADKAANVFTSVTGDQPGSALNCERPEGTREAKVIDFDPSSSTARLAVNLDGGRFTLATIKTWDRPNEPRPLNPIIEAAKIMQGKLQFFSRQLTTDPASAPDEYLIVTEMGGGYVCWAKPSWMLQPATAPVAEASGTKPAAPVVTPAAVVGGAPAPASAAVTRARRGGAAPQ